MIFEQGDVVTVDFSPGIGHEPNKERLALVVSNFTFNKMTSMTLVCPITSVDNGFPLHEPIPEGYAVEGFVVMEQIRALDLDAQTAKRLDHVSSTDMLPITVCLPTFFIPDEA